MTRLGTLPRFSNRGVAARWVLILVSLVVLASLASWKWNSYVFDRSLSALATDSALAVAHSISDFGNKQIVAQDWAAVQSYADDLVKERPLAYIAVVDPKGNAVVHTDGQFRGKAFHAPENTRDVISASIPVMSYTKQAATVWVGVHIRK